MKPQLLVQDSEYLETHLIVVPSTNRKEFLKSYETLAPMVVPRSSVQIAQDDEFTLFAVTTFKKHSAEFLQKCREQKWTPRQYKYTEGGREEEQRELDRVTKEERKVFGEAPAARPDGLERERHGMGARPEPARLRRNGPALRTAAGVCLRLDPGERPGTGGGERHAVREQLH